MKERTKLEAMGDIAMSVIPVAGSVYHGRKNHKEGFIEASKLYEPKLKECNDQKRQIRMDVFGKEQVFFCPESWDPGFWQRKLEVFVKEQYEEKPNARELLTRFLQFCIDNFPQRRLAQTLEDMRTVKRVIDADQRELAETSQEDIQLAVDFLSFYKDIGEIKQIKSDLVSVLPNTNGCNFLVLGRTGVGKSSLLNCLLGDRKFATGTGKPVTTKGIHETEGTLDGIKVRVYDSWGLEAGAVSEWQKMLHDEQEKHDLSHKVEDWFHAIVYCINAGGHRVEDVDRDIIRSLLQDDIYVVVALTQSDLCSELDAQKLRKALVKDCDRKLSPCNVVEVCAGGNTRGHTSKPFGIPKLKRAILKNYKKTIEAQLPIRCIHLAQQSVNSFREEIEKWIDSCEWKYNENENNRPLKQKCDSFAKTFLNNDLPEIIRREITACVQHGRKLASVLRFDDIEDLLPTVSPDRTFWESVGNFFVKTVRFLNPVGKTGDEEERERLRAMANAFCDDIIRQVKIQKGAIEKKVRNVMR